MPASRAASLLPRLITFGLVAACLPLASSVARAEVLASSETESSESGWTGFSDGFEPNWFGKTKRINWRRPGSSSGIVVTFPGGWGGFDRTFSPPKPVELLDASRSVRSDSTSNIYAGGEHVEADFDSAPGYSKAGAWERTLAYYAEVIDLDDLSLGRATSLSAMQSEASDDAFSMTSRVAADAGIDPVVNDSSRVTGAATANAELVYQFRQPARVDLTGRFRNYGGVNFRVTLKDHDTQEVLYEQFRSAYALLGEDLSFSFAADVSPGLYNIAFSADTAHEVGPSGTHEHGGMGEFSLDFRALALHAGDFDASGGVDSDDLDLWQASFGQRNGSDADGDGDFDNVDYDAWRDGPHVSDLTGDGSIYGNDFEAYLAADRPGDADGSGAAAGRDFLLWQRTFDPHSGSTVQAVPEPHAALLLVAAAACCVAGGRRI